MNEVVASMNGTLWIFAGILIAWVIVQSLLFLRHALNFNKKNKVVTDEEIKSATRTGIVSVFGPAVSSIVVALSLIAMVGPAVTFMRTGVIGAPAWELLMADVATGAIGVGFNTPEFTEAVFVLAIFGMTFASAPYFINTMITLKPLDMAVARGQQNTEKKDSFIPILGDAAMMGILGYFILDYMQTIPQVIAVIVSATVAYLIIKHIASSGRKWLGDWNMAISMVVGMTVAQLVSNFM